LASPLDVVAYTAHKSYARSTPQGERPAMDLLCPRTSSRAGGGVSWLASPAPRPWQWSATGQKQSTDGTRSSTISCEPPPGLLATLLDLVGDGGLWKAVGTVERPPSSWLVPRFRYRAGP